MVFFRRNEVKYAIFYSPFKREQQIYFLKSFNYQINSFLTPEWDGRNDESIINCRSVIHTIKEAKDCFHTFPFVHVIMEAV